MYECDVPQYSVQKMSKTPVCVPSNHTDEYRLGSTSCLTRIAGM